MPDREVALIVGAGSGLGAALARRFASEGLKVAVAARTPGKLERLASEVGGRAYACDATAAAEVEALFDRVAADLGPPAVAVYNPSLRPRGPVAELDPAEVARSLAVNAFGGFLVGRLAARTMLARGRGTILFTGASASIKGYPLSAPFAMGKFALRGLAQSMARELAPKGIHVAHCVIDGGIRSGPADPRAAQRGPDGLLDPEAIAEAYWFAHRQPRSAWTWEIALRPWTETF